jgi:hypothetical protein
MKNFQSKKILKKKKIKIFFIFRMGRQGRTYPRLPKRRGGWMRRSNPFTFQPRNIVHEYAHRGSRSVWGELMKIPKQDLAEAVIELVNQQDRLDKELFKIQFEAGIATQLQTIEVEQKYEVIGEDETPLVKKIDHIIEMIKNL